MKFRFVYTLTLFDDAKISKVKKKIIDIPTVIHSATVSCWHIRYHILYFHVEEFNQDFDSSKLLSKFIMEKRHLLKVRLNADFCIVLNANNSRSFAFEIKKKESHRR